MSDHVRRICLTVSMLGFKPNYYSQVSNEWGGVRIIGGGGAGNGSK